MKKLITILMVAALIIAIAVPASAADTYTISGVWQFNYFINTDGTSGLKYMYEYSGVKTQAINFTAYLADGTALDGTSFNFGYSGSYYMSISTASGSYRVNSGISFNQSELTNCFDFGAIPSVVHEKFYKFFTANAVELLCDGTSCPATDVDSNGFCDDCSKRFDVCTEHYPLADADGDGFCDTCSKKIYCTVPTDYLYGYTFPALSTVWTDKGKYMVAAIYQIKDTGQYTLVLGHSFEVDYCYIDDTVGNVYCKIGPDYARYTLVGNEWVYADEASSSLMILQEESNLIWASDIIYKSSTRVHNFFYVPPTVAGNVTETMLSAVLTEVVALLPMMALLLVGYLALRKALQVLATVLYRA